MDVFGKTIVITGVSSGIGAETARLAYSLGAKVYGVDRNEPSISLHGFVKADLSSPGLIDEALIKLPRQFDALVNAAGVPGTQDKQIVAAVNYVGFRFFSERCIGAITLGGSIVKIASILGGEWQKRLALPPTSPMSTST